MTEKDQLSIYLHIPFCTTKCTYCAFNTYINLESLVPAFVSAINTEIELFSNRKPINENVVGTIFFGGGTPTLLSSSQFKSIIQTLNETFLIAKDAEITTEANPNDLTLPYLRELRELGINRLSIGMQSADDRVLKLFARRHDHDVVVNVMPLIRQAGFDNVNIDLIYGSPYQSLDSWQHTLEETVKLDPEHISLYALGLEDGTPLKDWVEEKRVPQPDDDLSADMYELATTYLKAHGYEQYEISNWCKPGYECRHNLQYWRNLDYLGVGPGAHGFAGGVRYATILSPQRYVQALQQYDPPTHDFVYPRTPATVDDVIVDQESEIAETLIMGLRLIREGISLDTFKERFDLDLLALHGDTLRRYQQMGLLEITDERVVLTDSGRLVSNLIFRDLV